MPPENIHILMNIKKLCGFTLQKTSSHLSVRLLIFSGHGAEKLHQLCPVAETIHTEKSFRWNPPSGLGMPLINGNAASKKGVEGFSRNVSQ
jgi:hypothetical protein